MCVVKNEADIIQYILNDATNWADKVIVFDNGSTDGTWERVKEIRSSRIVPFRSDDIPYSDGLRADIFNAFKNELADNDWWVIQDADEVYAQNPRQFIVDHPGYFHHVNGKKVDFCFDLSQLNVLKFTGEFQNDAHLFSYYTPIAWSEPRMIKHRKKLEWRREKIWPTHLGLVCKDAIQIKHYPLRSPEQIKKRWGTRKNVGERGGQLFNHWEKENWEEYYLRKAKDLQKVVSENDVFTNVPFANDYRQGTVKRLVKRLLHKSGLFHSINLILLFEHVLRTRF